MSQNPSPYQYELKQVKITSGRYGTAFNVTASVAEIVLYEHLEKPYVSGSLVILDDANLLEDIDFQGSEQVEIVVGIPESSQGFNKTFFVKEIETAQNTNDNAQVLVLSIVDKDYYLNSLINVQKKYDGKPNEIIDSLIKDHMPHRKFKKSAQLEIQSPIRFIVPNMTPMGAMQAVCNRATDDAGSPYFLFACLADDDLRYFSLRDMMNRPAINSQTAPYRFNQKIAQDDRSDPALAAYNITNWEYTKNENLNRYILNGDVGAQYQYHDPISNLTASYVHDVDKIFSKFASTMVFPRSPIYDNKTGISHQGQQKKLHEFTSKIVTGVVTSRTFEELNNIHEDNSPAFHREKSVSKTLKNFLTKSSINISVPGLNFLTNKANITIGNMLSVEAFKNRFTEGVESNGKDNKKSGDYLIYATRHSFSQGRYEVTLTGCKLANISGSTVIASESTRIRNAFNADAVTSASAG